MGHKRTINQRMPSLDVIASVDEKPLTVRNQVLAFDTTFTLDDDSPFPTPLLAENLHIAIDFRDDCWILWSARLENLSHSRQTTGNILNAGRFTRGLGHNRSGRDTGALFNFYMSFFWQIVIVERLSIAVFNNDMRMQLALVIDNHAAGGSSRIFFQPHCFAVHHVLVADLARNFGQNRNAVRIPLADGRPRFHLLVFVDQQLGTSRHFMFFQLTTPGVQNGNLTVSGKYNFFARVVFDDAHSGELDEATFLGLGLVFLNGTGIDATDMEGTHRQLRTGLTDALSRYNANGHPLFDERSGSQVHAVTQAAHAQ